MARDRLEAFEEPGNEHEALRQPGPRQHELYTPKSTLDLNSGAATHRMRRHPKDYRFLPWHILCRPRLRNPSRMELLHVQEVD